MGRGIIAIVVAAAALCAPPAQASAWTRADGRFFVATKLQYFSADTGPESAFRRVDNSAYAEFGLFGRTAIGAKVDYGTSWTIDPAGTFIESGFSELEGFGQHEIWRRETDVGSVKVSVIAPARLGSGVRAGLASDGMSVEPRALYGRNLASRPLKVFTSVETAIRKNFGRGADEIRADVTFGAEPSKRFLLLLEAFSVTSLQNEDEGGADYDIYKAQASIVWKGAKRWRLQVGYNREFAGRNVALGETLLLGVWSEF